MNMIAPKRSYRQSARARAAEATGQRIIDGFARRLRQHWFDQIKLEDVAADAGVTVQTVIRRFGSKDGLLAAVQDRLGAEIRERRHSAAGDAAAAVSALIKDYEDVGELVMRSLAQEDRYAPMKAMTDIGRAKHREWIGVAFSRWLERLPEGERQQALDGLVVASDVYVWKLMRKDMNRPVGEYRDVVESMCAAALRLDRKTLFKANRTGNSG